MSKKRPLNEKERAELISFLDGELPPEEARAVEARLNTDPRVRAEADALERTWALLDHLPRPEPSPNFTNRTLDRLAVQVQRRGLRWQRVAAWAAVWLVAFGLGSACVFGLARFFPRPVPGDEDLIRDLHVLDNLNEYRQVGDLRFLRALDNPDLFGDELAVPLLFASPPGAPLPDLTTEDFRRNQRELERRRGEPGQYERLKQALADFHTLPVEEQDRLRRLDRELHEEDSYTQVRLLAVLHRYTAWLAHLSPEDGRRITEAADADERLRSIKEMREKEWVQSLPAANRREIEAKQGKERAALIHAFRDTESRRRREWADVVLRAAQSAELSHAAGLRLIDLPPELQTFIHGNLRPLLSRSETGKLDRSEGQGSAYARVLLELADKYGWAIPGSKDPNKPTDVASLNKHFRGLVLQPARLTDKEKEKLSKMRTDQKWPEFGIDAMEFIRLRNYRLTKQPDWAPCRPADFDPAIQQFLDRRLLPGLAAEEAARLKQAEGDWPEYPRLLTKLAREKGLSVPGMSLPGSRSFWTALASGLPEVYDDVLLDFALRELTAEERTTLNFSPADPTSRERLKEVYYGRHPDRLIEQLRSDFQKSLRKAD